MLKIRTGGSFYPGLVNRKLAKKTLWTEASIFKQVPVHPKEGTNFNDFRTFFLSITQSLLINIDEWRNLIDYPVTFVLVDQMRATSVDVFCFPFSLHIINTDFKLWQLTITKRRVLWHKKNINYTTYIHTVKWDRKT